MCRLFGMVAERPVDLSFSLERFKKLSDSNKDGWGIGWYQRNKAMLFKQSISAKDPRSKIQIMAKNVTSKIIIAHVRKGPKPRKENSHPFRHEKWLFEHNGQVDRDYVFSLLSKKYRSYIVGDTDSEVYFYFILQNIEKSGNVVKGIKKAFQKVRIKPHEGMNFLLTDGKSLYAFRAGEPEKDFTLYLLKKKSEEPKGLFEFLSERTKLFLQSKSLEIRKAVLICSEPITNEKWKEIAPEHLVVINNNLDVHEVKLP